VEVIRASLVTSNSCDNSNIISKYMIKKLELWFRFNVIRHFISIPQSFEWRVEDIQQIRLWAGNNPHPFSKSLTLWDYFEDSDTCWTLRNAEKWINSKIF
jgi:hypothetical protein